MHTLLVSIHAVAATIALLSGVLAVRIAALVGVHAVSTGLMTVTLALGIWSGRSGTGAPLEVVFCGLLGLAAYMTYRGGRAWRTRPRGGHRPGTGYLADVGFNLIGLVTGLLAISALGWGSAAVVAVAVGTPLTGRLLLARALRVAATR